FCSYCIVPYVRGREMSRPSQDIIRDIEGLVAGGVREVTLIGQNVNSYGLGLEEKIEFPMLLKKIDDIAGLKRIRFMTSHPKDISEALIGSFGSLEKLCEHIHLPVQSGSDRVLKNMNRNYSRDYYLGKISDIRASSPGISLTSDIIVGFPGETDKEFEDTMDLVERVRYDSLYTFKYSPRPETNAAAMPDQVDESVKDRRLLALQERQREISLEKNREYEGEIAEVLVEGRNGANPQKLSGKTRSFKSVKFDGDEKLIGELVHVKITNGSVNFLAGELV
ncbi:MAG: MiaB/RimO family radical SAM methylthiotransferase, partial [Deltaproteobacteria bacterium]